LTVLGNLSNPFRLDVLKGVFGVDAKAEHNGMGVIVGEGA
jgi:hypothetical protein